MYEIPTSRRRFIKVVAAGAGAALAMPASSYARILGANDRIRLGFIGMGRRSPGLVNAFKGEPGVEIAALCDVFDTNLQRARPLAPQAAAVSDFRRVIDDRDIDAVVIVTPDHWHALPTVAACQVGKDVYVEKPTAVTVAESRAMVTAARRHGRIVQVGTQQRSDQHFQRAVQFVRSGALGTITLVRTWMYTNEGVDGYGSPPDTQPPAGLDWDAWLGPAPRVPFNVNRFGLVFDEAGNHTRWGTWRYFWDYGGGLMTDWGVHLLDIALWAMDAGYPDTISAAGGKFVVRDNRDTPDTLQVTYQYPGFVCVFENRVLNNHGSQHGIAFHGTEGTLLLNRSSFEVVPQQGSRLEALRVERVDGNDHHRNFLESMRSRRAPISDIEVGHISSAVAMLGNVAYRTGRQIRWNAEREQAVDDRAANRLLAVNYRRPWRL